MEAFNGQSRGVLEANANPATHANRGISRLRNPGQRHVDRQRTRAAATQQQQQGLEEIVVTGSRIARRDFTAASPIITVGSEAFENISTLGVESALNQLPQFVPGGSSGGPNSGTQFGTGDVQSTASNSPGISVLNLRGLGPNRNLVLIDGRRAQPANATLVIDVNTIPSAAIETVEVITGGASAVYGADAIGGVVNFKLRNDFEGAAFDAQTSIQSDEGGEESRFSALFGGNFGEGGNAMIGMEWAKRNEVKQADRDFYVDGWYDPGTPSFGGPTTNSRFDTAGGPVIFGGNPVSQATFDAVFPNYPAGSINPDTDIYFNADGTAFTSEPARNYTGPLLPLRKIENDGGIGENALFGLVSSPLERYSLFGRAVYDISDNIQGFVQGNFTSVSVDQILFYSPATLGWGATIPRDGRALPADLNRLLDGRADPTAPWALTRDLDFIGPRTSDNDTTVYQIQTGVLGDLGEPRTGRTKRTSRTARPTSRTTWAVSLRHCATKPSRKRRTSAVGTRTRRTRSWGIRRPAPVGSRSSRASRRRKTVSTRSRSP